MIRIISFSILLLVVAFRSYGQNCFHSFNIRLVEKTPQNAVLEADYNPPSDGSYVSGEFWWYLNGSSTPALKQFVGTDGNWSSQYGITAPANGGNVSVTVTFHDFTRGCVSDPAGYTVSFCTTPANISIQYARACGNGIGEVQVSSTTSGATFEFAKLVGGVYQPAGGGGGSPGRFVLSDFYGQDADKYYVRALSNAGCPDSGWIGVGFDIQTGSPPTISGTKTWCQGVGTTLTASVSGSNGTYKWYNASQTVVSTTNQLVVPASLSAGTYNYSVEWKSPQGCITQRGNTTVTVNPRPVDPNISANTTTICLGQSVQISSAGGVGTTHYYCSSDNGASWNVFSDSFIGQPSFSFKPTSPGKYIFHVRSQTACGFCWDAGNNNCPTFPTVEVTVTPPLVANAGPDQTVASSATLHGSATGGNGGTISYQWTQVSGPSLGLGTYNGATLGISAATGQYVLRLTVTNGCSTAQDEMTLKVVNFSLSKINPPNICVNQPVTMQAVYTPPSAENYFYIDGEFRWYLNGTRLQTSPVGTDMNPSSDFSFTPPPGITTVAVTFYDKATQTESPAISYQVDLSPPPTIYIVYARECGDGIAHIQMGSSSSEATFQFYKRTGTGDYEFIGGVGNAGHFQLSDFYGQEGVTYYVRAGNTSGCELGSYMPINIDVQNIMSPPDVTGNTSICEGAGTTLTANPGGATGTTGTFTWYNVNAGVESGSPELHIPNTLAAGTYNYSVERVSPQGCTTPRKNVTVTVMPRPVDGTISASPITIHLGQSVQISSTGGIGTPHYYCSSNNGASWNVFSDAYIGQSGFNFKPASAGKYIFHVRNQTACGFCWDPGNNCSDTHTVEVTVTPDYNYIMEYTASKEGVSVPEIYSLPVEQKTLSTTFFDGLGRPMQVVNWQSTPSRQDHVLPIRYEENVGRETRSYLPYASGGTNGWYKIESLSDPNTTETTEQAKYRSGEQYKFYQDGGEIASDQFPFAETIFENSPLDRVSKQGAAGASWQPKADPEEDRSVKKSYLANGEQEVFLFHYNPNSESITISETPAEKYYPIRSLTISKTFDEHNNETLEYTDKDGRTVCKKVQYDKANNVILYACTYYLYDNFGNLVAVVPPKAVDLLIR